MHPAHPVQVWWARLDDARAGLLDLLDPVERRRYETTVDPAGRGRFLVGCALSRLVLGDLLGMPAADVPLRRVCPRCGGPHGKVRLDTPAAAPPSHDFSVTHSGAVIGVALCENGQVGLDVEDLAAADCVLDVDSAAPVALADCELTALYRRPSAERKSAFLRTWTRKEAVLKALGVGLGAPLRDLVVSAPDEPPAVLAGPARPAGPAGPASWPRPPSVGLADLVVDGTHPAAVAAVAAVSAVVVDGTDGDRSDPADGEGDGEGGGDGVHAVRVTVHDGTAVLAAYDGRRPQRDARRGRH